MDAQPEREGRADQSKDWKGKNKGENDCKLSRVDLPSEEEDYFQNFQSRQIAKTRDPSAKQETRAGTAGERCVGHKALA